MHAKPGLSARLDDLCAVRFWFITLTRSSAGLFLLSAEAEPNAIKMEMTIKVSAAMGWDGR